MFSRLLQWSIALFQIASKINNQQCQQYQRYQQFFDKVNNVNNVNKVNNVHKRQQMSTNANKTQQY